MCICTESVETTPLVKFLLQGFNSIIKLPEEIFQYHVVSDGIDGDGGGTEAGHGIMGLVEQFVQGFFG